MQLASLLPIGGRLLRASLVSAVGVALSARLAYALARRVLDDNADTPRLSPPLALSAALVATLAPAWQLEGTIAGGATLAVALVLAGLAAAPARGNPRCTRLARLRRAHLVDGLREPRCGSGPDAGAGRAGGSSGRGSAAPGTCCWCAIGAAVMAGLCAWCPRWCARCRGAPGSTSVTACRPRRWPRWTPRRTTPVRWWRGCATWALISLALAAVGGASGPIPGGEPAGLMAPLAALVLADVVFPASRAGVLSS